MTDAAIGALAGRSARIEDERAIAYHKHITVNPLITVDGDEASASSYFLRVDSGKASSPSMVFASGRYVDELTRDPNGRWRIRSRRGEVETCERDTDLLANTPYREN